MMEVYRYISFEKLKDIVENKTLYFVNPFQMWPDEKEGFLYRAAQQCEELMKINEVLEESSLKKAVIEQLLNGGLYKEENSLEVLDWFGMRCQSWSKSKNDCEMWKAYSRNNCAVCIAVDTSKLLSLRYGKQKVEGFDVEYTKELSFENELDKAIGIHGEFYFAFLLRSKTTRYKFENEYRLYLTLLDENGHFIGKSHEKGVNVDIPYNISGFIKGVYCNPEAPDDYKGNVKKYCNEHTLLYIK